MASKEQHLKKAEHNERFFNHLDLDTTLFLDWIVTGIFYSALHYIRAIASMYGFENIASYGELDKLFDRLSILKRNLDIYQDYRQLKDDSRDARYEMIKFVKVEVQDLRDQEFSRIKSFVLSIV
ncbi:MAG: hypothetical protein AMJ45_05405 [Syntrophobacter sp. DG_60]|nr:MAG: hypothetical protein AMJ45_05405 [Syntrophobacter sp. DG_60]